MTVQFPKQLANLPDYENNKRIDLCILYLLPSVYAHQHSIFVPFCRKTNVNFRNDTLDFTGMRNLITTWKFQWSNVEVKISLKLPNNRGLKHISKIDTSFRIFKEVY